MSDRRYTAIFGVALLTAGTATFSVYRILRAAATPRQEPTQAVIVLGRDLPAGVPIPREALTQVPWPSRVAPAEAFSSIDSVAGRVTRVGLTQGEPVRSTELAPRGAAPGLEGTIDPSRRAIAVRVSEAAGMSGLVRPNSRVDVLVAARGSDGSAPAEARLVMADVRVLGVGPARPADVKPDQDKAPDGTPLPPDLATIVTLEVTPTQAAQVAAAETQGSVQVVLRGYGSAGVPSVDLAAVARPSVPAAKPPAPVRPVVRRVVVVRERPVPAPIAAAAPALPSADSVTIRVYRNGQLSTLRVEVSEPVRAPAPPPLPVGLRTAAGAS